MLAAHYKYYPLDFYKPAITSRGVLHNRQTWFLFVYDKHNPGVFGTGECGLIPGLSIDNPDEVEGEIRKLCENVNDNTLWLEERGKLFPAIKFALQTALADLQSGGKRIFGDSPFVRGEAGIPVNGLIWMGDSAFLQQQIISKLEEGFSCLKMKIGAITFEQDLNLIRSVRQKFGPDFPEIRVDANGAFSASEAPAYLERLSLFNIHSIEQPIRQGQWEQMAELCRDFIIPVALDEELIGVYSEKQKRELLQVIKPQYIILKPGLLGGLDETAEWASIAREMGIGWWATSALESNIGLNAIAQWTFSNADPVTQGLGTGQLFSNNIPSPLEVNNGMLFYNSSRTWELNI